MAMEENDAPVVKEENTNESDDLKRRREFMQYIRIKDDTNDPDKEVYRAFCFDVFLSEGRGLDLSYNYIGIYDRLK